MAILKTNDFIKSLLIDELGTLIDEHPYVSFIVMGIGIEFLGKCIDSNLNNWNKKLLKGKNIVGGSKYYFENAIRFFPSLKKYEPYLTSHKLYDSFRCGIAHTVLPKYRITLSSKGEMDHLVISNGRLNLKVENFFEDFKTACEFVMNKDFPTNNKMNRDFMEVPDPSTTSSMDLSKIGQTSLHKNSDLEKASASGAVKPYIIGNQENE